MTELAGLIVELESVGQERTRYQGLKEAWEAG